MKKLLREFSLKSQAEWLHLLCVKFGKRWFHFWMEIKLKLHDEF